MLIIAGHLDVDPSRRDDLVAAHEDLMRRARQFEGCLDIAIAADVLDRGRINNYERWSSREALDAWREVADAPDLDDAVVSANVHLYTASDERDPF